MDCRELSTVANKYIGKVVQIQEPSTYAGQFVKIVAIDAVGWTLQPLRLKEVQNVYGKELYILTSYNKEWTKLVTHSYPMSLVFITNYQIGEG